VERLKGVDGIGEAELFADPLKEPRAHSAAKEHPDHCHRVAPRIAVRESVAPDHDVGLGCVSLEVHCGGSLHDWSRRFQRRQPPAGNVGPASRLERLQKIVVLDVSCRGHDDLLGMIGA